jgi:DNA-binding CsgD family transcriptional regulator
MTKPFARTRPSRASLGAEASIGADQLLEVFAAKDLEALIDAAFRLVRATVTCDFASAYYRSAGDGLMKSRTSDGRVYEAAFMRRSLELNPAIPLAAASPGVRLLHTRAALPRATSELVASAFFREVMQPQGWRHSVALCFWGEPVGELPIFVVSADRRDGRRDFSDRELARLGRIHPLVDCAVNRLQAQEAATNVADSMAIAVYEGAIGFAILDRHRRLVRASAVARQMCTAWAAESASAPAIDMPRMWRLPAVLETGCRELLDEWRSAVHADPDVTGLHRRHVANDRDPTLTASITLVGPDVPGLGEPTFLLEFGRLVHGVAMKAPDWTTPLLKRLTEAERAVALVTAEGLSNQEIADRLGKTVHAVKFLLHRIYRRTGVPGRAALVALMRAG